MSDKNHNLKKGIMTFLGKRRPACRLPAGRQSGQSAIEFAALVVFLLAAFLVFQKYIARGIYGRWKGVGDGIGQERIYDPNLTSECEFHPEVGWYDRPCYEAARDADGNCFTPDDCYRKSPGILTGCKGGCDQN